MGGNGNVCVHSSLSCSFSPSKQLKGDWDKGKGGGENENENENPDYSNHAYGCRSSLLSNIQYNQTNDKGKVSSHPFDEKLTNQENRVKDLFHSSCQEEVVEEENNQVNERGHYWPYSRRQVLTLDPNVRSISRSEAREYLLDDRFPSYRGQNSLFYILREGEEEEGMRCLPWEARIQPRQLHQLDWEEWYEGEEKEKEKPGNLNEIDCVCFYFLSFLISLLI